MVSPSLIRWMRRHRVSVPYVAVSVLVAVVLAVVK